MNRGFTVIVEGLIIIAIIGIFAAIAIPNFIAFREHERSHCVEWYSGMLVCHEDVNGKEVCNHLRGECRQWEKNP